MKYIPIDSYGQCLHNKDLPADKTLDEVHGHAQTPVVVVVVVGVVVVVVGTVVVRQFAF